MERAICIHGHFYHRITSYNVCYTKLLRIVKNVVRGQYTSSMIKGEIVKGYQEENGVREHSRTETYAAMQFYIDNWRWGGVPFYIRTGKRLPTRVTEIAIRITSYNVCYTKLLRNKIN